MQAILAPTTCGSCGFTLAWRKDLLFCENSKCAAQISKQIEHFSKTLKIKGLGPKTIEKLELSSLQDIYRLDYDWATIALSSKRLVDKLFIEIEHSKKATLNQLLPAFSIPLVGKTATEKLSSTISRLDEITVGKCHDAGLGTKTTESLMNWYNEEYRMRLEYALPFSFKFDSPIEKLELSPETLGVTICISGKLTSFPTKAKAAGLLTQMGYIVKSTLTKEVNFLVNESGIESAKTKKARESGVTIVTNLLEFIGDTQ